MLAVYADRFEEVNNPWPMLDLLLTKSAQFQRPELVENYISVLQYLCRRFPDYRRERGDACWRRVCGALATRSESVVTTAYYGLCAIAEATSSVGLGETFPMEWILKHIKKAPLQPPIVSLLLRRIPPANAPGTEDLVRALVGIAEQTEKGCYILMKMAKELIFDQAPTEEEEDDQEEEEKEEQAPEAEEPPPPPPKETRSKRKRRE